MTAALQSHNLSLFKFLLASFLLFFWRCHCQCHINRLPVSLCHGFQCQQPHCQHFITVCRCVCMCVCAVVSVFHLQSGAVYYEHPDGTTAKGCAPCTKVVLLVAAKNNIAPKRLWPWQWAMQRTFEQQLYLARRGTRKLRDNTKYTYYSRLLYVNGNNLYLNKITYSMHLILSVIYLFYNT